MHFLSEVQLCLNGLVTSSNLHVPKFLLRWPVISRVMVTESFRQFYNIISQKQMVFNHNTAVNCY